MAGQPRPRFYARLIVDIIFAVRLSAERRKKIFEIFDLLKMKMCSAFWVYIITHFIAKTAFLKVL